MIMHESEKLITAEEFIEHLEMAMIEAKEYIDISLSTNNPSDESEKPDDRFEAAFDVYSIILRLINAPETGGITCYIYNVAKRNSDGSYTLNETFDNMDIIINDNALDDKEVCVDVLNYALSNPVPAKTAVLNNSTGIIPLEQITGAIPANTLILINPKTLKVGANTYTGSPIFVLVSGKDNPMYVTLPLVVKSSIL